jgi:glycosyltransferase involved in cell wall biosynthesis
MQVYGESVRDAVSRVVPAGWIIDDIRSPEPPNGSARALRWNRFVSFPRSLRPPARGFHILVHAHANLIRRLPRERTVITVHDIMPVLKWRGRLAASRGRPPLFNLWSFSHLRRAAAIAADSHATKQDLVEVLACDPARIHVIPPGIDACFRPYSSEERAAALTRLNLAGEERKRILLSGHQFYKNHDVSRQAIRAVAGNGLFKIEVLWLSASDDDGRAMAESTGVPVRVYRDLTRAQVTDVYNAADVLLFPSIYEGFGWPPLEAMACGVPVVTSTARALAETTTGAALAAEPGDWERFAGLVLDVLSDSTQVASLRERGLIRASRYTWDVAARRLIELYRQVQPAS